MRAVANKIRHSRHFILLFVEDSANKYIQYDSKVVSTYLSMFSSWSILSLGSGPLVVSLRGTLLYSFLGGG